MPQALPEGGNALDSYFRVLFDGMYDLKLW